MMYMKSQGQQGMVSEGKKGPRLSSNSELHNCVDGVGVS